MQRHLSTAGFLAPQTAQSSEFCRVTHAALIAFQDAYGLKTTGECDELTWSLLHEASWHLGDRLLYLRSPNLRGDDIAELQTSLSRLGFDCGRVDGIFGPRTARSVKAFQQNCGLTENEICGPEVVKALGDVGGHGGTGAGISAVREAEELVSQANRVDRRVVTGQFGSMSHIGHAVGRMLRLSHPLAITLAGDANEQARAANTWGADVYVGIEPSPDESCTIYFYQVPTFTSIGGQSLANRIVQHLDQRLPEVRARAHGLRIPILRETKMPAVLCSLGPQNVVLQRSQAAADAILTAIVSWLERPLDTVDGSE